MLLTLHWISCTSYSSTETLCESGCRSRSARVAEWLGCKFPPLRAQSFLKLIYLIIMFSDLSHEDCDWLLRAAELSGTAFAATIPFCRIISPIAACSHAIIWSYACQREYLCTLTLVSEWKTTDHHKCPCEVKRTMNYVLTVASPVSENFRLANLTFNWSPLENKLKIKLPFVGFPP